MMTGVAVLLQVMWRRLGIIHPLTIGNVPFVSDSRVSVVQKEHPDDDYSEWNLRLRNVAPSDEGTYKCQVNTKDDQKNFYIVYLHISSKRSSTLIAHSAFDEPLN